MCWSFCLFVVCLSSVCLSVCLSFYVCQSVCGLLRLSLGWDKNSFGYHADDGHSFCSSGNGQPYGPTFTTGDTVGCCLNLINHTCFFTKNGVNLGTVFTDLPVKRFHLNLFIHPTSGFVSRSKTFTRLLVSRLRGRS